VNLQLKPIRSRSAKMPLEREWRRFPPGMHGWRRGKTSEYGRRLREKQKVKRYYGVRDEQFVRYVARAAREKGNTGEILLQLLERRLDNVVCKLGFGLSRPQSRQMVNHGHIRVNGRRVNIPSFRVSIGDVIGVKDCDKTRKLVRENLEVSSAWGLQNWIIRDENALTGTVVGLPTREDVEIPVEEQLIVELCSR
jgi:small subunit ribosomal protein S4